MSHVGGRYLELLMEECRLLKEAKVHADSLRSLKDLEGRRYEELSSILITWRHLEKMFVARRRRRQAVAFVLGILAGIAGSLVSLYTWSHRQLATASALSQRKVELEHLAMELARQACMQTNGTWEYLGDVKLILGQPSRSSHDFCSWQVTFPTDGAALNFLTETGRLLGDVKETNDWIRHEMGEIKDLCRPHSQPNAEAMVVVKDLDKELGHNSDSKVDHAGLWTLSFTFSGLALFVPVIYALFNSTGDS